MGVDVDDAVPRVGEGIDALMRKAAKEEFEAVVKNKLMAEFDARVERDLRILNDLLSKDLLLVV